MIDENIQLNIKDKCKQRCEMSNNIIKINKNKLTGKKMGILAAAALTATLIGGSVPVVTEPVSAAEAQESTSGTVIPDNITIDQPT